MQFDHVDCTVLGAFLGYLFNDDPSALTNDEISWCDDFVADLVTQYGSKGWHFADIGSAGFARCDITGQYGDCENIQFMFPLNK